MSEINYRSVDVSSGPGTLNPGQENALLSIVSKIALTALYFGSFCVAGLLVTGVLAFSTPWIAPVILATALIAGITALFFVLFYSKLPTAASMATSFVEYSSSLLPEGTPPQSPTHTIVQMPRTDTNSIQGQLPVIENENQDNQGDVTVIPSNIIVKEQHPIEIETTQPITKENTETDTIIPVIPAPVVVAEQQSITPPSKKLPSSPLIDFYSNSATLSAPQDKKAPRFSLNDFRQKYNKETSANDAQDYLLWAFPIDVVPTGKESSAPILNQEIIEAFKTTPELQIQVVRAFDHAIDLYGFIRKDFDLNQPQIIQAPKVIKNQACRGEHRCNAIFLNGTFLGVPVPNISNCKDHFARMIHIIKSLKLLGLPQYSVALYHAAKRLYDKGGSMIPGDFQREWASLELSLKDDLAQVSAT